MKVAIRYQSRGGNVKAMAEAIARGCGVDAVSFDSADAKLTEPVDLLFVGGGLYGFQLDKGFKAFLENLPEDYVGEAICFGSSMLTRRPVMLIQDVLKSKGISINKQAIWSRNHPNESLIDVIEYFAEHEMTRDRSLDGLSPALIFKRAQERKEQLKEAMAERMVDDSDEEANEDEA